MIGKIFGINEVEWFGLYRVCLLKWDKVLIVGVATDMRFEGFKCGGEIGVVIWMGN